jgi:hypothetical protein
VSSENRPGRHPLDGDEPTHNRSVAGSRPASPHHKPQVTGLRRLRCLLHGPSLQVPGQAKQIEARLLEEIGAGRHKGSRSRTMAELLERWLEWRGVGMDQP